MSTSAPDIAPAPALAPPSVAPLPETDSELPNDDERTDFWLPALIALGLGVTVLAIAWFVVTRRRRVPGEDQDIAAPPGPASNPDTPLHPSAPAALPLSASGRLPRRPATRLPADDQGGLKLTIEPASLRVSLAYATLICRAAITNNSDQALGPVAIRGDLVTAHRAVDQRATLSPDIAEFEPLATIETLAAGMTIEERIELKLPLNAIVGFRKAGHQFFVPLVRLACTPPGGRASVRIWTVGTSGGARLGPICADTPRLFSELSAIEIDTERWLALDPVRAAS